MGSLVVDVVFGSILLIILENPASGTLCFALIKLPLIQKIISDTFSLALLGLIEKLSYESTW